MSKIVKKKYLDVLIENTLKKAGLKRRPLISEAKKEYDDENLLIIKPTTHEEMCQYGANTKWCVSSGMGERFFNQYGGEEGNLKVYINKNTDEKVIEDLNSGRIYDQDDMEIEELPDWAKGQDDDDFEIRVDNSRPVEPPTDITLFPLVGESKKSKKPLINEGIKKELEKFNKLTNFNYKY